MAVDLKDRSSSSDGVFPLSDLPDACIANAISRTSPKEACRLALVGATFRSVADSDLVWERFLPPDYRDILSRSEEGLALLRSAMPKKQLYLHLCENPILIDDGTKSFSLEKSSGKKCYMLSANNITIIWGSTPEYWKWISLPQSRFELVAQLIKVCWLEICGNIKASMLSPNTKYTGYLVFSLESECHGFDHPPVYNSVGLTRQARERRAVRLDPDRARLRRRGTRWFGFLPPWVQQQQQDNEYDNTPVRNVRWRGDGYWMEAELGEIFIEGGEDLDVEMRCEETRGGHWKSGLIVEGIEIRPKE